MAGLYIHIPFCKQACSYCDFYFSTKQQLRQPFVDALVNEIHDFEHTPFSGETVNTIYIGGGTPSLLDEYQLSQIFEALKQTFQLDPKEVTMELNPDDVTPEYLEMIRSFGVDRASMGVQSFHPDILTFMHRAHNPEEAIRALEALQKTGFPSFTADLIYGNPGQSLSILRQDLEQLLAFNPPHVSAYSLTVEPKTRLGKQVALGRIQPPDDEEVSEHFDQVQSVLEETGLKQYEVSNFSKPGLEALHNSNYWNHHNYLGLGPSAHSFWRDDKKALRWRNRADLKLYLQESPESLVEAKENLTPGDLAEERLMLGLRTIWGVDTGELAQNYGYRLTEHQQSWVMYQTTQGTVQFENNRIILTKKGLKIADLLIVDLLSKQ
jgi:oxygen-independent coproporphyrinogen III oxidase